MSLVCVDIFKLNTTPVFHTSSAINVPVHSNLTDIYSGPDQHPGGGSSRDSWSVSLLSAASARMRVASGDRVAVAAKKKTPPSGDASAASLLDSGCHDSSEINSRGAKVRYESSFQCPPLVCGYELSK